MTVRSGSDTCPTETPLSPTETLRGRSTRSAPTPATVGTADTYAFAASVTPPDRLQRGKRRLAAGSHLRLERDAVGHAYDRGRLDIRRDRDRCGRSRSTTVFRAGVSGSPEDHLEGDREVSLVLFRLLAGRLKIQHRRGGDCQGCVDGPFGLSADVYGHSPPHERIRRK